MGQGIHGRNGVDNRKLRNGGRFWSNGKDENHLINGHGDRNGCFTLFIDNLQENLYWKGLWAIFCSHGNVIDAFIPTKRSKGGAHFGFIRFAMLLEARTAVTRLNGVYIYGSRIGVSMAKYNPRQSYWRNVAPDILRSQSRSAKDAIRNDLSSVEDVIDENKLKSFEILFGRLVQELCYN
ncbi:serine/arginine-rich splicing factor SC35-like [Hibiscus syriacus]|uniref:serine/arginine-rich splicing factor SC35-like n=1 Tax=Hibiscus syriacus TaxID=106335 RepID=UPI001921636A|nr:serine/arginine-rich splicing factor SC35-like [Hibiscus syriacus]